MKLTAKVIQGWTGEIIGEALVTHSKISFLGDVDLNTGLIVAKDLDIQGHNLKDKILVFPEGRGSTVGSNVLYGLARKGLAPKLIAVHHAEPITISGAIYGCIPMVTDIPLQLLERFKTGEQVKAWISYEKAYLQVVD